MVRKRTGEAGWRWLCQSTVTVYRRDGLTRQVLDRVFFDGNSSEAVAAGTAAADAGFLLVVPGACDIAPGDKIFPGVGPAPGRWQDLNSADVPGLGVVRTVAVRTLAGQVSHVEVRG